MDGSMKWTLGKSDAIGARARRAHLGSFSGSNGRYSIISEGHSKSIPNNFPEGLSSFNFKTMDSLNLFEKSGLKFS